MGATASVIGRVAAGVFTLGATEALGVGDKAGKATSKVFLPGVDKVGDTIGNPNPLGIKANASESLNATVKPGQTEAEREREARLAAERRRKDFQNLGRSSTLLTGPGGLSGSGMGKQTTLLGR